MTLKHLAFTAAIALVGFGFAAPADAALMLHDDFSDSYTSYGSRSGSASNVSYLSQIGPNGETPARDEINERFIMWGQTGMTPDHSFTDDSVIDNAGFYVSLNDVFTGDGVTTGIAILQEQMRDDQYANAALDANANFGFTLTRDGDELAWNAYTGGNELDTGSATLPDNYDLQIRFTDFHAFANPGSTDAQVLLDGQSIFQFTLEDKNLTENYISFFSSSDGSNTSMDSFTIAAVPEPASLALLAAGSLLMLGRGRRKSKI